MSYFIYRCKFNEKLINLFLKSMQRRKKEMFKILFILLQVITKIYDNLLINYNSK